MVTKNSDFLIQCQSINLQSSCLLDVPPSYGYAAAGVSSFV